jgi:catechol 2,3-dioxygenase-like lactoylglutathione lyase family enzyme
MITGFHHFSIACSDANRSIAFYRDLFGMRVVADRDVEGDGFVQDVTGLRDANVRIVHLQGHGFNFELLQYREPSGATRARGLNDAGTAHLCFTTDDLDATCADLAGRGVTIRSRAGAPVAVVGGPNDGGKVLYVEDPDGNAVELMQLARPWPQEAASG